MVDFWDSVAGVDDGGGASYASPSAVAARPTAVPTRKTAQSSVDEWNAQMRQSPVYLNFMQQNGLSTDGRVKLSKKQQEGLERALSAAGMAVPGGMHIDQGGNLNQKNTLGRNVAIGAAATGAALTGFGMAGMGPMAGLFGGGTLGAGGVGGMTALTAAPAAVTAGGYMPAALAAESALLGGAGTAAASAVPLASVFGGSTPSLAAPAGLGMTPSLAAENIMFGGGGPASMIMPAAHGMSTMGPQIAAGMAPSGGAGGGFSHTLSGLLNKPGVKSQIAAGGFNLTQAAIAAQSAKRAAQIQAQYGNRALDFEQGRYDRSVANTQPYVTGGQNAFASLGDILKTPRSYTSDMERLARGGGQ